MNCDQARELIGADPDTVSVELRAHLDACPECQAYREQMLALNAKIRRAFEFDLSTPRRSEPLAPSIPPTPSATEQPNVVVLKPRGQQAAGKGVRRGGFAIAASLAAGLLVAFTLWLSRPEESLASEIVTHVEGEPNSWSRTQPVSAASLDAVLRKSAVMLGSGMDPVVYASSCWFRGHFVPHFVVMTKSGPATVMILLNERISAVQQFKEDGYSGILVPARTGSVAVLSRAPMSLEQPAGEVVRALQAAERPTRRHS
jgi:hypothetical protein